ncbi:MAG: YidC/Oxa1 family membrane protein insertase [Actinomycetota bacterium]
MGFFEIFAAALAGFYAVVPSYGLAIILLTVIVRLLLLPLTIKQTRSMREMQLIQPEVKKLQAKYKGNRQKLNEETMKLYKEHNVNPFGGCLPLVMQFPVFIALYRVLYTPLQYMGFRDDNPADNVVEWVRATGEQAGAAVPDLIANSALARGLDNMPLVVNEFLGFLRLDCSPSQVLSGSESLSVQGEACGSGVISFIPYVILMLLMGYTTYYQQKQMQSSRGATDPQAQQMQMFMKILPLMLLFFSFTFPSGLTVYWLTTNVWTIGQQRLILKKVPPVDLTKKKATPAKGAGDGRVAGQLETKKPGASSPGGKNSSDQKNATKPHPSSKKRRKR